MHQVPWKLAKKNILFLLKLVLCFLPVLYRPNGLRGCVVKLIFLWMLKHLAMILLKCNLKYKYWSNKYELIEQISLQWKDGERRRCSKCYWFEILIKYLAASRQTRRILLHKYSIEWRCYVNTSMFIYNKRLTRLRKHCLHYSWLTSILRKWHDKQAQKVNPSKSNSARCRPPIHQ